MIKTFVSYHHERDQEYKEAFVAWAEDAGLIENRSVEVGHIEETLPPQTIRRVIRDRYLMDSDVTILLCGLETRFRKHIDWELKSSMIDGSVNRQSGILVIDLPTSRANTWHTCFPYEKDVVYPDYQGSWRAVKGVSGLEKDYPDMPRRILENLVLPDVKISVVPWHNVYGHPERLEFLLRNTAAAGRSNPYDTSRTMRMKNFNPQLETMDFRR